MGRLEEAKGFNLLLSTLAAVANPFSIGCDRGDESEYAANNHTRNIRYLGKLSHEETLTRMGQAKYLIHPALAYETFGLTILEAMARQTPVIGFNIGTRAELIQSGYNGFLTEPQNLEEVIKHAHDFPNYANLCEQAGQTATHYYSDVLIQNQIQLYKHIMHG